MKYNIFVWPTYSSINTFDDVAKSFYEYISKKYECSMGPLIGNTDTTNIVFGANENIVFGGNKTRYIDFPKNCIIVNLEQLSDRYINNYMNILSQYEVWDYSDANIKYMNTHNITNIKPIFIGYTKSLKFNIKSDDTPIDVLFYGAINERRKIILDKLQKHTSLNIKITSNTFGDDRNALISQSKVIINIHYYPSNILEVVRISHLLANGKCVVSEKDNDEDINNIWKDGVILTEYDNLVDTVLDIVNNNDKRKLQEKNALQFIYKHPLKLPL